MSETGKKLIDAIKTAAGENPDFIYKGALSLGGDGCVYVRNGQPSCLVGKGAWDIGLIDASFENRSANSVDAVTFLEDYLGIELDDEEGCWLENVQSAQDCGKPWGEVVRRADEPYWWDDDDA